jgi:hypothetical protein
MLDSDVAISRAPNGSDDVDGLTNWSCGALPILPAELGDIELTAIAERRVSRATRW